MIETTQYFNFWHRSFTFHSNKSPTWCKIFSVYSPDVCSQLNMFRAFSRPSSGAQKLQWQPLVLPSYRGDSRAVLVVIIWHIWTLVHDRFRAKGTGQLCKNTVVWHNLLKVRSVKFNDLEITSSNPSVATRNFPQTSFNIMLEENWHIIFYQNRRPYSSVSGRGGGLEKWVNWSKGTSIGTVMSNLKRSGNFFNLLKPTGYVMHQQFNIQQLYALPTRYLCVLHLSEKKQRLVPVTA